MGTERKPPQSVEELLERYAAGERDFAGAILSGAKLQGVQLRRANLKGAQLTSAELSGAELTGADLRFARLSNAAIAGADLSYAKLNGADLSNARLMNAVLVDATLAQANLIRANLTHADLFNADLTGADLLGTMLLSTILTGATLQGANFAGSNLAGTLLLDIDLSPLCEAEPLARHVGPSTVDFRAIVKSFHCAKLNSFLQRTGMPEVVIEALIASARQLQKESPNMLQSTFISYGGPDTAFAQQLNDALLRNGVTTFFFAKDALPGKKLHRLMREGVNSHDRVILVCSKASLNRPGVLNEITETLQREARDGGKEYLIPVTLDDYVFSGWNPEDPGVAQAIKDRVVADFRGAEADPAKFQEGLLRLIAALHVTRP